MIPFKNDCTQTETDDLYTWSLRELCKAIHLHETTQGPFRANAAKLRDKALSLHNKHRASLGEAPLGLSDFQLGNEVIFKRN